MINRRILWRFNFVQGAWQYYTSKMMSFVAAEIQGHVEISMSVSHVARAGKSE
jgi:hypothetical protein